MTLNQGDNRLYLTDEKNIEAGEITYREEGDLLIVEHTYVFDGYNGLGLGKKLVLAMVELARNTHRKVRPECHYARSVLEKTPEWQDVLSREEA